MVARTSSILHEVWMCNPSGVRTAYLDYVTEFEYSKLVNDIAPCYLRLPFKFNRNLIALDNMIEIWRGYGPYTMKLDYLGFLREWVYGNENGMDYTELHGFSVTELLKRRHVAHYSGSAQADMVDYADDMLKEVVQDALGSDAAGDRNLTSVGGGFTIQAQLADAPSISKAFAHKNLLAVCKEIAQASKQAGTDLFFDIVPSFNAVTTGMIAFQFQTFTGQRNDDRTWDSSAPIYIGPDYGNFENGRLDYDCSEEINYCTARGRGKGAAENTSSTEALTATSEYRSHKSIWNLREGYTNSDADYGDTAHLTGDANTFLDENKPKFKITGDIVENPYFRYGLDWNWGDKVTISFAGFQRDALINKVFINRDSNGHETITAKVQVDE